MRPWIAAYMNVYALWPHIVITEDVIFLLANSRKLTQLIWFIKLYENNI